MRSVWLWIVLMCALIYVNTANEEEEFEEIKKESETDMKKKMHADLMDALKVSKKKHPAMRKLFGFLTTTPYILKSGRNAIEQLIIIKKYAKKFRLKGDALFKNMSVIFPGGSFFKNCKQEPYYSDSSLPFPHSPSCCPIPNTKCRSKNKYRTIDGSCNCMTRPNMGRSNRAYSRHLPPDYADGLDLPRAAKSGNPLPSCRDVSVSIYEAMPEKQSPYLTVLHMTIGQLLDHDTDRTPVTKFEKPDGSLVDVKCGEEGCETTGPENEDCYPIPVSKTDPYFTKECLMFVRSQAFVQDDCKIGPREQPNVITSWFDVSFMYGSTKDELEIVRDYSDSSRGRMISIDNPMHPDCGQLLPQTEDKSCRDLDDIVQCFQAGDARRNEQVGLTSMHTTFIRLHNLFEDKLHEVNPHWGGDKLFEEARRLVIAVWQNMVYKEYIPVLLGKKQMKKFGLNILKGKKCFKGYSCDNFNADVANQFATASFRFGHSQVGDTLRLANEEFTQFEDLKFSSVLFRPRSIYEKHFDNTTCGVEAILLGHAAQPADKSDRFFTEQMSKHLFTDTPPKGVGADLPAMNTQRGRDHGLPGYTKWRRFCGLSIPQSFEDMDGVAPTVQQKFKALYEHVDDVDLFPAAMAEEHVDGGIVGPTFACLLGHQFKNTKFADRFWFERCHKSGLKKAQIENIRKYTFGRFYCDTLQSLKEIQPNPMMLPLSEVRQSLGMSTADVVKMFPAYESGNNERMSCDQHPGIDFNLWKEKQKS